MLCHARPALDLINGDAVSIQDIGVAQKRVSLGDSEVDPGVMIFWTLEMAVNMPF